MASAKGSKADAQSVDIPEQIADPLSFRKYERQRFLGKGGFARCYELKEIQSKELYAGKIVSKQLLKKQHQKDKMTQEITIHRNLHHRHVVEFHSFFEDHNNVYIVLELCRRRSLMEMHKRRRAMTEPETRYFMRHLVLGVKYLHDSKIIHRDLKLGNLFLNDDMELKIGDFGLATRIDFDGERKKTLCGTPNYIAPEVLKKKGHSFEVDIWSIGCILYTLLVGRPPFETQSLEETYKRIKENNYKIPTRISYSAQHLISLMLQPDPHQRPAIGDIMKHEFMTHGYLPKQLPISCLTTAPRFDSHTAASGSRRPLLEVNCQTGSPVPAGKASPAKAPSPQELSESLLRDLHRQLASVLKSKPSDRLDIMEDEAEDPMSSPFVWISKWVDYSDKYGFGYQLSDDSIGVVFNDLTKLLLLADGKNVHYIERNGNENYHKLDNYPLQLDKKVKLLNYFQRYMSEHLLKAGANAKRREGDELSRIPSLRVWFRTSRAVVLQLTNGSLQINFFQDHTKIILCPLMSAVTYMDGKNFRTYKFELIEQYGCSRELSARLQYALDKVDCMVNNKPPTHAS